MLLLLNISFRTTKGKRWLPPDAGNILLLALGFLLPLKHLWLMLKSEGWEKLCLFERSCTFLKACACSTLPNVQLFSYPSVVVFFFPSGFILSLLYVNNQFWPLLNVLPWTKDEIFIKPLDKSMHLALKLNKESEGGDDDEQQSFIFPLSTGPWGQPEKPRIRQKI